MKKVLIIDSSQSSGELGNFLTDRDYFPIIVGTVDEGLEKIESENLKVVLLNVELSGLSGLDALERIKSEYPEVIVIVIKAGGQTARRAMRLGALDVLSKDTTMEHISEVLDQAFDRLSARSDTSSDSGGEMPGNQSFLVGESEVMFELNRKIGLAASFNVSVLLEGEPGTGKGLVASLIHKESDRASERFVTVDCGALPDTLLESELFGHVRGAFAGARPEGQPGRFEFANGGTLFLDEVANMSPALQMKLLNVLQTGELSRLGENRMRSVDVRVICATNQNLEEMVERGEFRLDLFHRLCGYKISLPPLRERIEDISLLVAYFLQRIEQESGRPTYGVNEEVMELFQRYNWPGNVRELEQCLKSAAAESQGEVILPNDLPPNIQRYRDDTSSRRDGPERHSSETSETPVYRNLFDLPVVVFSQFIADAESGVTDDQIARWWMEFSNYGRERAVRAKRRIDDWRVEWNTTWFPFLDLLERIKEVIDNAISQLSNLRHRMDPEPIEEADLVSIVGKTFKGSLAAVLHESVKEHGGNTEEAATELNISIERLNMWLSYWAEDDNSLRTSIEPSRELGRFSYEETRRLLIEPILVFILENFAHIRWRDKNLNGQMRTVHLDLRVLSKRLAGEHGYIYFGGMTFSQIEESIYRRAQNIYTNLAEAAEALNVDPRTVRRYWPED